MKSDRIFYSTTAGLILAIMFIGFRAFFISGHGQGGRTIDPTILPTVVVHGVAITAWYVLFLVQALLIAGKNRRLHMKLGWISAVLVPVIAVSGLMVAIRSAQGAPANFVFFGMPYRSQFSLIMLTEIVVFTLCVMAGMMNRKRPEVHRAMMLSASLSLLLGATARMPWLNALFGGDTSTGFFGPVFALGAGLLIVNSLRRGKFDRPLAAGYGTIVVTYLLAAWVGSTTAWQHLAIALLQ
ncbi:MAG: hypothetical protein ABIV50_11095 [Opitutus sp.]